MSAATRATARSSCSTCPVPYSALYAHLSSVAVHKGQHVRKGQRLGQAGCTGSCSGTHLHFEVKRRGVRINPLRFIG